MHEFSYLDKNNVVWTVNHRKARIHQHLSKQLDSRLMFPSEHLAFFTFQDLNVFPCQQHGGQRLGREETCSTTGHCVHQGLVLAI